MSISMLPHLTHASGRGTFTGNIQTDFQYYKTDSAISFLPIQKFGLNSWNEFTFRYEGLTAGLRYEAFQDQLIGYNKKMKGQGFPYKYINYKNHSIDITAGSYYAQFGNGLLLRSFQDKGLGIDNALEGIKVKYSIKDIIHLQALSGKPRYYFDNDVSTIRGADALIEISNLLKSNKLFWTTGFSYVNRHYPPGDFDTTYPAYTEAYSIRSQLYFNNLTIDGEIAEKSPDPLNFINNRNKEFGNAYYLNASYAIKGFGLSGQYKRVKQFDFRSNPLAQSIEYFVNFVPPIAKFFSKKEFTRYPFASNGIDEQGMQYEVTYSPKIGKTFLVNYSKVNDADWNEKYYETIYLESSVKINKKIKSIFIYQYIDYNKVIKQKIGKAFIHVIASDVSYRFAKKKSIRSEIQYLYTKQDDRDWIYGLVELTFAPSFTFAVADEINLGNSSDIHYYALSVSYTKKSNKFILTTGRQSEGFQCAGGVCRYIPAYSGVGFSILSTF